MGCDIHAYIEESDKTYNTCFGEVYLGRDYKLFALMADVRNSGDYVPVSDLKGLPQGLSWEVQHKLSTVDGKEVDKQYIKKYENTDIDVLTDYHGFSWLSLKELKKVQKAYSKTDKNDFYNSKRSSNLDAIVAAMEQLKKPRLVFWFDC